MAGFDYKIELSKIPEAPGVYRYYDTASTVIYVGKAKNLKNRVTSYFIKNHADRKTRRLVAEIVRIEFTIVHTEFDALLLENTLIKKYQPRFNILLRDDKMYPYICITNEPFPRVITERKYDKKIGSFYGPFANSRAMYALLEMFRQLFTIRTCTLSLTAANIKAQKFKVCLEYHLKNCKAPCVAFQSNEHYETEIEQIRQILKGNLRPAQEYFAKKMNEAAQSLEFEMAHQFKEKLLVLEKFKIKSTVVNPSIADVDVFAIASDEHCAYLNFLKVINGTITQTHTVEIKKKLEETDADILTILVWEMREKFQSEAKEIITNIPLSVDLGIINTIPQIGDKRKLLDMSVKNVVYFRTDKSNRNAAEASGGDRKMRVLLTLKNDLQIKTIPRHIECFDNSNIQGTNPVSAMVCFRDGQPAKKDYRHFIPKTVVGPNDFATMYEVVLRRYTRLLEEESPLPDLIIVDGGKGQLSAACDALKALQIYGKVPIIGIAKRLEEIYFPEDSIPLYIDKKSESLKLIQRLRDEAHRFGITHHRDRRSRAFLVSELEEIEGIGKITATKLLQHFKTISKLREASTEAIAELLGNDKATRVREFFDDQEM